MQHSVTFSGSAKLIGTLALIAHHLENDDRERLIECLDIWDDIKPGESEQGEPAVVIVGKGQQPGVSFLDAPQFETGPDGLIIVPPKKQREKAEYKAHREAAEKARAEQEAQMHQQAPAAPPQAPTEPNAYANHAIQQQHQWAQQPVQQAPSFPQQATGFPAAQAQTQAGFPASNPAQAPVATNGQPWLNPATINQQGPTFEQLNQLIQPIIQNPQQRQILGNWMQHKGITDLTVIADQPAVLSEAYQIATQIINGQIQ